MKKKKKLLQEIKSRKTQFIKHNVRHNEFMAYILEGKIFGRKG